MPQSAQRQGRTRPFPYEGDAVTGKTAAAVLAILGLSLAACAGANTASPTSSPAAPTEVSAAPSPSPLLPSTAAATPDPHVAGADCAACHTEEHKRWATTLHAASPAAVLLNKAHDTAELLTNECLNCHTPFQAATFKVVDFVQPINQKGPWKLVAANVKQWQAIKCEVCHDPTSHAPNKLAFFDPATHQYVPVATTTDLCEKCHQPGTDDSRDLKGSVHEGMQCASCHFVKGTEMSLDPHQACATCHPKVNPTHPDVAILDTTDKSAGSKNDIHFVTCKTCHP
jgi:hypothetical protein